MSPPPWLVTPPTPPHLSSSARRRRQRSTFVAKSLVVLQRCRGTWWTVIDTHPSVAFTQNNMTAWKLIFNVNLLCPSSRPLTSFRTRPAQVYPFSMKNTNKKTADWPNNCFSNRPFLHQEIKEGLQAISYKNVSLVCCVTLKGRELPPVPSIMLHFEFDRTNIYSNHQPKCALQTLQTWRMFPKKRNILRSRRQKYKKHCIGLSVHQEAARSFDVGTRHSFQLIDTVFDGISPITLNMPVPHQTIHRTTASLSQWVVTGARALPEHVHWARSRHRYGAHNVQNPQIGQFGFQLCASNGTGWRWLANCGNSFPEVTRFSILNREWHV